MQIDWCPQGWQLRNDESDQIIAVVPKLLRVEGPVELVYQSALGSREARGYLSKPGITVHEYLTEAQ